MSALDLALVVAFLAGLVVLAGWLARHQHTSEDYFLGGRQLAAWALGLSLAANQVSAISLVGAPAFVALRQGGGLIWLQYELAVPLAMAGLILWGVPVLRRARGADVYSAVESRLGTGTRRLLAAFFLLGRGLGAGVVLYTSALVVEALTGWGLHGSLLLVGLVTLAYTALGGLVADVFSDVLQLALLWGGTLVAVGVLAVHLERGPGLLAGIDRGRLVPMHLGGHGLGDGETFAFLPMLVGGFFLYLSYYGCDQTQAQRILAAHTPTDARKALAVAAAVRFPLVATYCFFGVLLATLVATDTGFAADLTGRPPDALVPVFLVRYLPSGVLGIAVSGILAAALSSLDSALNSLSAVTLEEFSVQRAEGGGSAAATERKRSVLWGPRALTVAWGVWATLSGLAFSRAGETVIEVINRVGSVFYGSILGVFVLAWRARRATGRWAVAGALAGVGINVSLWVAAPGVSWLWWNVVGFAITVLAGEAGPALFRSGGRDPSGSGRRREPVHSGDSGRRTTDPADSGRRRLAWLMLGEFVLILGLLTWLTLRTT
ncbi:MAG: hypothetical protein PVJ02_18275 [Gemmatimonadota bacterium]|jgi:SSS family solute:Na+ symporter